MLKLVNHTKNQLDFKLATFSYFCQSLAVVVVIIVQCSKI